jgi:hypothetical protein
LPERKPAIHNRVDEQPDVCFMDLLPAFRHGNR